MALSVALRLLRAFLVSESMKTKRNLSSWKRPPSAAVFDFFCKEIKRFKKHCKLCVLYLTFFQSHGVKFKIFVRNFMEDHRVVGIRWPEKKQGLIEQHGGRNQFNFELKNAEKLILEPKMQLDLEKTNAFEEEEFIAFSYADFPSKMCVEENNTLGIYYVVKKKGIYLWDYNSHIDYIIQSGQHRPNPRDEDLYLKKGWQTVKD